MRQKKSLDQLGIRYKFDHRTTRYVGIFDPKVSNKSDDKLVLFFDNVEGLEEYVKQMPSRNKRMVIDYIQVVGQRKNQEDVSSV